MGPTLQDAPLRYWIYRSRARVPALSADSTLIYLQARNRNAVDGLTGYLHREGDLFVQYIEGPPAAMDRLESAIRADRRHDRIRSIGAGEVAARRFDGWDMAFTEVERHLFTTYQRHRGRSEAIEDAREEEILAFMRETIRIGQAQTVRDAVPRTGTR